MPWEKDSSADSKAIITRKLPIPTTGQFKGVPHWYDDPKLEIKYMKLTPGITDQQKQL
jgi:hypothetical protein